MDINCDMGEGFGPWQMGRDEEIMPFITSANVACGAHAGDPNAMAATVRLARKHGVAVGAHPGYPDLNGFGRRVLPIDPLEVGRWILYQLGALYAIARSEGVELSHVKPHGALYNAAAKDQALAEAIANAVKAFSTELLFFCPPGSEMHNAARKIGLSVTREGFADRAYEPSGLLMNRSSPGSVHTKPEQGVEQALQLAEGWVRCSDGTSLRLEVDSICIHSDTPGAPEMIRAVRAAFVKDGVPVERMKVHAG
jgi:UPF0271 protein